jgi:hypothetical protein
MTRADILLLIELDLNYRLPELQISASNFALFLLFLNETLTCDHSKEPALRDGSIEWSHDRFR